MIELVPRHGEVHESGKAAVDHRKLIVLPVIDLAPSGNGRRPPECAAWRMVIPVGGGFGRRIDLRCCRTSQQYAHRRNSGAQAYGAEAASHGRPLLAAEDCLEEALEIII